MIGKEEMAKAIWPEVFMADDSLVQCTVELRRALGDPDQRMIKTIPRRGYLFAAAVRLSNGPATFPEGARELSTTRDGRVAVEKLSRRFGVPVPRRSLVGREKDVTEAVRLLLDPDIKLLRFTGNGGAGKTRLALAVAKHVAEHFPGGAQLVALASLTNRGLVGAAIVKALNFATCGQSDNTAGHLRSNGGWPRFSDHPGQFRALRRFRQGQVMKNVLTWLSLCLLILVTNAFAGQSDLELHRRAYPTVNFAGPQPTPDAARSIRNKRFEYSAHPVPLTDVGSDHVVLIFHDPYLRMPAVPKSDSDVIVRGTIADAKAFLTDHLSTAYSEFTVQPIEYFKGEATVPESERYALPVIRQGANVQFRSGTYAFVRVAHQAAPKVGSTYIMFLKRDSAGNDFDLITAYLVERGKILPLDPDPNGKYAVYNGVDESVLINALK